LRVGLSRPAGMRRRGSGPITALLTGSTVFVVVIAISVGIFLIWPNGSSASAPFIPTQAGAVHWSDRQPLTILLMGATSHAGGAVTTDMMVVATFDPARRRVTLLSIPPDLWVTVPGFGQGRIAEAYGDGGPHLALLTVESVTHIVVPYYAAVSDETLVKLVDSLGGVGADIPSDLAKRISTRAGKVHMSGRAALAFVHTRTPASQGDVGMMRRQREMLAALAHQVYQPQTFFQLPSIITDLGGSISTNFPYNQVLPLVNSLSRLRTLHTITASLDYGNGSVTNYGGGTDLVLLPDWQHITTLTRHLFENSALTYGSRVEVLNGGGVSGQAESLATWLAQAGARIAGFSSASSFSNSRTSVSVARNATRQDIDTASAISTLLQIPVTVNRTRQNKTPVVITIGRDFLDPTQQ
jgi:LCP family protein required for cell wall assembly